MPESKYFLETDASVRPGERHRSGTRHSVSGAGVVLWDPNLRMVLAESIPLGQVSCGPEAELWAVLIGLRLAKAQKVDRVRLRSDCLAVVQHLAGVKVLETQWAARYKQEIRELLRSFTFFEARWTPSSHAVERRTGVPTADFLARRAVGLGPRRPRRKPPLG
jgi:ribonuclease HI